MSDAVRSRQPYQFLIHWCVADRLAGEYRIPPCSTDRMWDCSRDLARHRITLFASSNSHSYSQTDRGLRSLCVRELAGFDMFGFAIRDNTL